MQNNNVQIVSTMTFGEILNSYSSDIFHNSIFNDLIVYIDNYNQCWFQGIKVAEKLGYTNPRKAITDHVHLQYKMKININGLGNDSLPNPLGGNPNITLIHEHGLYQLILSSQLPDVWRFQQWVYSIIENMRRYGIALSQQREQELYSPVVIVPQYMRPIIDQMRDNMHRQQQMINELQPKANYYDEYMQNDHIYTSTQIAKDFGMSAQQLHNILHELHVIYQINKDWVLYDDYSNFDLTLTQIKEITPRHSNIITAIKVITGWTEKGKQFIYNLLKRNGHEINNI